MSNKLQTFSADRETELLINEIPYSQKSHAIREAIKQTLPRFIKNKEWDKWEKKKK